MQTRLPQKLLETHHGQRADEILRRCVHCGFCNATCPTYQISGDELEGPRGRIYLIKEMLEGKQISATTEQHLDSCLTCQSCETTCPSGVGFAELMEIGRSHLDQLGQRKVNIRLKRWLMRKVFTRPKLLKPLFLLSTLMGAISHHRKIWPYLTDKPAANKSTNIFAGKPPVSQADETNKKVILLDGCVQSVTAPNINDSLCELLNSIHIQAIRHTQVSCCGALDHHNGDEHTAMSHIKRNIDTWWKDIQNGAEAIIMSASGCGVMVKDYQRLLAHDPEYAVKAKRVSQLTQDASEFFSQHSFTHKGEPQTVAFHAPCTLTHGQQINGVVESILRQSGHHVVSFRDKHLCCGSAGTYSLLHPDTAVTLRTNKLRNIEQQQPDVIATANIGCLMHLQKGTETPVRHWLELVAIKATMEKNLCNQMK